MNIEIYSTCLAAELAPNMVVNSDRYGLLVVDEVRKLYDGGRIVVDVYGRRPDAPEDSKNRRRVRYAIDDTVQLDPEDAVAHKAWNRIVDAVRDAAAAYEDENPDSTPWVVADGQTVRVRVGGETLVATIAALPAPPPDPDDVF